MDIWQRMDIQMACVVSGCGCWLLSVDTLLIVTMLIVTSAELFCGSRNMTILRFFQG
jgi:hypothetical protein